MAAKFRPGALVKLLDPQELALDNCTHGIILGVFNATHFSAVAYRILCGDRILILDEYEFEVVEQ